MNNQSAEMIEAEYRKKAKALHEEWMRKFKALSGWHKRESKRLWDEKEKALKEAARSER